MATQVPLDEKYSIFHCPRCDKKFIAKKGYGQSELLERVIKHVSYQHPDYDPEWHETHSMNHHDEEVKVST